MVGDAAAANSNEKVYVVASTLEAYTDTTSRDVDAGGGGAGRRRVAKWVAHTDARSSIINIIFFTEAIHATMRHCCKGH